MSTISLCMIVRDEEDVLERCLSSVADLVDEIIIVDTGSTDHTKEIAAKFTDQIFDFAWTNDFSKARNFSFSKATKEYIYVADADEVIDEENRKRFLQLKQALLPEIEIVQMYYVNQLQYNTTYNFNREYRPKLYKRLRTFCWEEPIHEMIRLTPIIYDSEVEIQHCPISDHSGRDFYIFQQMLKDENKLSKRLQTMYAKELFIAGTKTDFLEAEVFFEKLLSKDGISEEEIRQCQCVLARCARLKKDKESFFKHCLKNIALNPPSCEVCFELGEYFLENLDYEEATIWYYNAAYETQPELAAKYGAELALNRLADCYSALGNKEEEKNYRKLAQEIKEKR